MTYLIGSSLDDSGRAVVSSLTPWTQRVTG
jgi:hypothetical protein